MGAAGAAAGLAAFLSLVELITHPSRSSLSWRSARFVTVRLGVDAAAALVAYWLLWGVSSGFSVKQVLVAGGGAMALLRAHVAVGSATDAKELRITRLVDQLRTWLDRKIDEANAIKQSDWLHTEALPKLAGMSGDEMVRQIQSFVSSLDHSPHDAGDVMRYIEAHFEQLSETKAKARVVLYLCQLGWRGKVRQMMRSAPPIPSATVLSKTSRWPHHGDET